MIIEGKKYHGYQVTCPICEEKFIPSTDAEFKQEFNFPPIVANIFCSRKCKGIFDKFLDKRNNEKRKENNHHRIVTEMGYRNS